MKENLVIVAFRGICSLRTLNKLRDGMLYGAKLTHCECVHRCMKASMEDEHNFNVKLPLRNI
jgi:hypothetical protein